jgi:hypothetical protein
MKATVTRAFGDKLNGNKLYNIGDPFSADEKRVAELEAKGFVKADKGKAKPKKK